DQLRILAQQQLPLRIAARSLSALRQLAPGGRGLVDHRLEATERARPFHQRFRRRLLFPVVDEFMLDPKAVKPPARLPAGIAVLPSIQRNRHVSSETRGVGGVALRGTVGDMDVADKPPWTGLRRVPRRAAPPTRPRNQARPRSSSLTEVLA